MLLILSILDNSRALIHVWSDFAGYLTWPRYYAFNTSTY